MQLTALILTEYLRGDTYAFKYLLGPVISITYPISVSFIMYSSLSGIELS